VNRLRRSSHWAPAVLLAAPFVCSAQNTIVAKQLAGAPEEFAAMMPADPIRSATHSKSALLPVTLEKRADGRYGWTGTLPVAQGNLRFVVFSGDQAWQVNLQDPISKRLQPAESLMLSKQRGRFGIDGSGPEADAFTFEHIAPGDWNVSIDAKAGGRGFLLVEGEGGERLMSHQAALNQRVGERITMLANVYDLEKSAPLAARSLSEMSLRVTSPDGSSKSYPMFDDGVHQDGIAGDGVFGADFLADQAGDFNAQVFAKGTGAGGQGFVRTSEHLIPVIDQPMRLTAASSKASVVDANRIALSIPVAAPKASGHYRTYGEVWGMRAGKATPVAWIGGMSDLKHGAFALSLDARWIAKAGAQGPFELRNLRIEDPDHFITMASAKRLPIAMPTLPKAARLPVTAISDEMRMGPRPANLSKGTGSRLLLVHGYCSGNVWGGVAGQFSNASVFADFNQNRSHDAFARLIQSFGNTWNSYGIVAHSQGGAASLHLYNYYWSGLDNATGARLIQSVGTPYRGTALAGNAAALGNVFGVGCGTNSNLTYSGASSWLAGISTAARGKANYFTTSFTDRAFLWDYCNVVTDVLLSDPEDGTTEQSYGQLPSGVNRGHKTGWCHTSGMRDPAQATDSSRNATMNSNAAR
jgi:hypothetical protein